MTTITINGTPAPSNRPCLLPTDRGWTLGDGVFETIRTSDGQPLLLDRHLARLRHGAQIFALDLPPPADLAAMIGQALDHAQLADAVIRLSVSRGVGQRGLAPSPDAQPTVVIAVDPFQPYATRWYDRGVTAVVTGVARNEQSPLARVKSLSYADQVLARLEAQRAGVDLGLQRNTHGQIVCADCANLWVIARGRLITPPPSSGALAGIARSVILEIAGDVRLEAVEADMMSDDLLEADEALLTNVLLEVAPLVEVNGQRIGDGKPGMYAKRLRQAYRRALGLERNSMTQGIEDGT